MLRYSYRTARALNFGDRYATRTPFPGRWPLRLIISKRENQVETGKDITVYNGKPSRNAWRIWENCIRDPDRHRTVWYRGWLYDRHARCAVFSDLDGDGGFRRSALFFRYYFMPEGCNDKAIFESQPLRIREGAIFVNPRFEYPKAQFHAGLRSNIRGGNKARMPENIQELGEYMYPQFLNNPPLPGPNTPRRPGQRVIAVHAPEEEAEHTRLFGVFNKIRTGIGTPVVFREPPIRFPRWVVTTVEPPLGPEQPNDPYQDEDGNA